MALTILDAILHLPQVSTEFRADLMESENGYITLVTDVSSALPPHGDFDFNGEVLECLPRAEFISKYGNVKLTELNDFRVKNIKLIWTSAPLNPKEPGAVFMPNLVIRILEVLDSEEIIHFVTLRNKYGSSLTTLTYQKPKK